MDAPHDSADPAHPFAELALERSSSVAARVGDRTVVWFAGCDYLGLAHHPAVVSALCAEAERHGVGSSASRATSGTSPAHVELEDALARFLGVEAALLTADGYLSNLVALQALAPRLELAGFDRASHVSLRDALRAVGVRAVEYDGVARAREIVRGRRRVALATDGVFPSSGRLAPLDELAQLLGGGVEHLVVDDCHGLGVLGARGRGACEHFGLAGPAITVTGTLSKTLGTFGGFVAGARTTIDAARTTHAWIGATPIPPALARAALAALRVLEHDGPARLARLRANVARLAATWRRHDLALPAFASPVFALRLEDRAGLARAHAELLDAGLLVPCVDYPDGTGSHLRIALSSEHAPEQIDALAHVLDDALRSGRWRRASDAGH